MSMLICRLNMGSSVPVKQTHGGLSSFQSVSRARVCSSVKVPVFGIGNPGKFDGENGVLKINNKRGVSAVSGSGSGISAPDRAEIKKKPLAKAFAEKNKIFVVKTLRKLEEDFRSLVNGGSTPDVDACKKMILRYSAVRMPGRADRVLEILEESGAVLDVAVYNAVLSKYCQLGRIDNALKVFNRMKVTPNVSTYNFLIEGTCKMKGVKQANNLLVEMRSNGYEPDADTRNAFRKGLKSFNEKLVIELDKDFKSLEESMVNGGSTPDARVCKKLIIGFHRTGRFEKAARVLEILEKSGVVPDGTLYNAVVTGYCKAGKIDKALNLLKRMRATPNISTYNSLIEGTCKASGVKQAMKLFDEMKSRGCKPDVDTYNVLIEGLCKEKNVGKAIEFMKIMEAEGCSPNVPTYNALMCGCVMSGKTKSMTNLLEEMKQNGCKPDEVTYRTLIYGLCKQKDMDKANEYLEIMAAEGCQPSAATYNIAICGFSSIGKHWRSAYLLEQMKKKGCKPDVMSYNLVISGLAGAGRAQEAMKFLEELEGLGEVASRRIYNAIWLAIYKARDTLTAMELLDYMIAHERMPTKSAYLFFESLKDENKKKKALESLDELSENVAVMDILHRPGKMAELDAKMFLADLRSGKPEAEKELESLKEISAESNREGGLKVPSPFDMLESLHNFFNDPEEQVSLNP